MEFDSYYKQNIIPNTLENKERYLFDLILVNQNLTGRVDAWFSNQFLREAVQLVYNAITVFEMGYFDCGFYSLRQALEISTTSIYFVDDSEENRKAEMRKWKNQERFPMQGQMISELQKRKNDFADVKSKMHAYFDEIEETKGFLNKYVHKQGFDKFYAVINSPLSKKDNKQLIKDFEGFLTKTIGAITVLRLVIDPFPVLLNDEHIYNRTGDLMSEGLSENFLERYIGLSHIETYKQSNIYKDHYDSIIQQEEMHPSVVDIVKHSYINRDKIDEILSQKHLLGLNDTVAVALMSFSDKISKVYSYGGWHWHFSDVESVRKSSSFGSSDFDIFKDKTVKYNVKYDEAFLSCFSKWDEDFYIEHNVEFNEVEIEILKLNEKDIVTK